MKHRFDALDEHNTLSTFDLLMSIMMSSSHCANAGVDCALDKRTTNNALIRQLSEKCICTILLSSSARRLT